MDTKVLKYTITRAALYGCDKLANRATARWGGGNIQVRGRSVRVQVK